ncbi:hypothetical protein M2371_001924 [Buttiauxella sp. BIGb0471]|uniref:hypothetical protein n=1 Tax=Buttiauxella sp. BIGb0471 TaxID=2940597 RepID=UPI002168EC2B|nr:hypothetical protein [Buttiauxella sp. BIGb0471]MCS3602715.1 hypothetical protein [Buttiauxella sp. BIGb0471]
MRERGMIFNGEMVRAILNGSKTQTRRIMKVQPEPSKTREGDHWFSCNKLRAMVHVSDFTPGSSKIPDYHEFLSKCCPFGEIGDRIWVRETFEPIPDREEPVGCSGILYAADIPFPNRKWTPSIHMPRWASRISLEITNVRVEWLNAISEKDANAEGVQANELSPARYVFGELWQSIYGADNSQSWQASPWVWVIEFKRVEANNA